MSEFLFRCFASGSSGNCYYLGTRRQGILIDAGISARTIRQNLFQLGLDFPRIMGVLITHDHADHIRAVGTIGERFHVPIYATREIHDGIDRNYGVTEKLRTSRRFYEKGVEFDLMGMKINTFGVSHDSTDCVAYMISYEGQNFLLATDVGKESDDLSRAIRWANHIVLEANHDEHLLLNGPYPSYLKSRILSDKGHQSNNVCAKLLADNYHPDMRNIWLCHLSKENNDPQVAYQTVSDALTAKGVEVGKDVSLVALERTVASPIYDLKNNTIITTNLL